MGRPPIGKLAMTDAERQRRRRERLKSKPASKPEPPRPTAPQPDVRSQREHALQQALATMTRERDQLRREVEALRASPPEPQWMRNQLRDLRSNNAKLRKEVAELTALTKLPPEIHKRYLASCRRWRAKKQAELNLQRRALEERERTVGARTGAIPNKLWRDLMLCLHPDRSASNVVLGRAFDEMRKRESVLRQK